MTVPQVFFVHPISIHAPREGSDAGVNYDYKRRLEISIHAPREGSDNLSGADLSGANDFNPRSP